MNKTNKLNKVILLVFFSLQFLLGQNNDYLILISWDGCRWDYLNRGITPNVQKLIDGGVRAESLQPSFPSKTFPNHYTLVTGLYPQNHGIIFNRFTDVRTGDSYRVKKDGSIHEDKWYKGESLWFCAQKQGIKSGVVFWPGSETHNKHPDYFLAYDHNMPHEKRIDQMMEWIDLPEGQRPHLLLIYFPDTDDAGHKFGPDSKEVNQALKKLDTTLGELICRLKKADIFERTNIVLVSDHGMTPIYKENGIDISNMLSGFDFIANGYDPNLTFFPDEAQTDKMYEILKKNEKGYYVYRKEEIPHELKISKSPYIGEITVMANPGYYFKINSTEPAKGAHGFDNKTKDMHGVFVAYGPAFKSGFQSGTIQNIDVYPLLCKALDLTPSPAIDGQISRVEHLLRK